MNRQIKVAIAIMQRVTKTFTSNAKDHSTIKLLKVSAKRRKHNAYRGVVAAVIADHVSKHRRSLCYA